MKLTLHDRYALGGVLPVQGTWLTLKALRVLRESLGPSEAETKEFGVTEITDDDGNPTGRVKWDPAFYNEEREIDVGDAMLVVIVAALTKLSEEGKLHVSQMSLYTKFVDPGPQKAVAEPA